jgi:hypothetical protein
VVEHLLSMSKALGLIRCASSVEKKERRKKDECVKALSGAWVLESQFGQDSRAP